MTVLILSLWAFGILLLIAVAVYRGKSPATAIPAEMSDVELTVSSSKVTITTHHAQKIQPDAKSGTWKGFRELSPRSTVRYGKLVASAGKPFKPGLKGTHLPFPKPDKSVR